MTMTPASGFPFTARLVTFAGLLRDNGFLIAQPEIQDAQRALLGQGLPRERQLRNTLKVLFCARQSEIARFDDIFDAYWHNRAGRRQTVLRHMHGAGVSGPPGSAGKAGTGGRGLAQYFDWSDGTGAAGQDGEAGKMAGAASVSGLAAKDFASVSDPDERAQMLLLAERLGARMRARVARRRKVRNKGRALHLRRTLRASVSTGGLPCKLVFKRRTHPPVSLLLFVDVSGSMDSYSLFFTRFVHALTSRFNRAEAFIFHTRLVHVTRALREVSPVKMMQKMSLMSQGWSGGTRIGAALGTFNDHYAAACADSRTVAILMSDGFDTGDAERLTDEIRRLKRRCQSVFWLNPMAGKQGYRPETRSMAAVLPHLDLFAPAHNLSSLKRLEDALVRA